MIFTGRLDQDTNVHLVKEGDYLDAMNIRNGVGSERGVITVAEGNTLVEYGLPANAQCIGAFENKQENSIIYFIKGDEDRICRYKDGVIETLIFGDLFDQRIHSCKFVNNLCYFTDGKNGQGNPPRKFNITKASRNKTLTYQLDISTAAYGAGGLYTLIIKTPDGTLVSSNPLYVAAVNGDRATVAADLISALSSYGVTAVASQAYTNLQLSDPTNRILEITGPAIFYPLNHYPLNVDLNLIKPVPPEPIPVYEQSDQENNKVYGFSFQFRYRYVFDDGEKSAWGPASYTTTNFVSDNSRLFDRIRIDFSDPRMNDSRHVIRGIELGMRTSENGIWRFVDRYDIDKTEIYFYNDKSYPAIASDEASDADTQALKNYDFCPEIAMSCETVYDENGSPIMVWSGCVEGKDLVEVDCTIDSESYIPAVTNPQTTTNKTFKSGGLYECVVVWEDKYGRQAPSYIGKYSPQFNRLGQNYHPLFSFNSLPPIWATKYRIAMSKNQNQSVYFQAPAWELRYWKIDRAEDTATSTTYAAGDATHVGLAFNPTEEISGSLRNQFFDAINPGNVFVPRTGDRVQFLSWLISGGSNPGYANIKDYNFDIVGYNLTTVTGTSTIDKFSIFIEFKSDFPDFSELDSAATDYILCEVYTPSNSTSPEVYYEIGPTTYIEYPGTENRTAPQVSLENYGDAVLVAQRFDNTFSAGGPYFVTPQIERNTLHKNSTDVFTDFGRVVVRNPDEQQRFERNKIRATGLYTEINGLSSFRGSDYVRCSIENGTIGKLAFVDGVLLAIGEFKTQPIYVSRGRVIDASGQTLLSRSSNLFSIADELRYDLGTQNPESVVVNEGACYAFDVYRGTVWRYVAGAGQDIISQGLVNFFQAFGQYAWAQGNAVIVGGFQREYNTYYISGTTGIGAFTLGYNEGWVSFYSFYPEAMCSLDQRMVSFYEGALWLHESGVVGTYYGLQTKAKLKLRHAEFERDKPVEILPLEINIVADKRWDVPLVEVPIDGNYALGQISKIPDLRVFNGVWKGSFLRDERDPNFPPNERLRRGRKLWGTAIVITVETNIFSRLLSITVNAVRKSN